MKPVILATSGVSISNVVVFDLQRNPFSVGIGCVVTGTVTYTIQHTFDDVGALGAANVTWFDHDSSNLVAATTNQDGSYTFPCRGARINQTAGTGTVTATFIQSGYTGA